jgi:site-specific DNA recombinase
VKPRALLYARVSTADKGQDWQAQLQELEKVARQRGWQVVARFHDTTSGAKALRPGMFQAMNACRAGGVDIFAAVTTDRIARSVKNLLELVGELEACGVRLSATREGALDTTTPQGRAFMQVRAVFAELERSLTAERVREALAVRRARGVVLGRRATGIYDRVERARELRAAGLSWSTVTGELGGTNWGWARALERAQRAA